MSDGPSRAPSAREFSMLCEKLDRLDRKNDESHKAIFKKLDEVQGDQGQIRERLVAIEAGLGSLQDLRQEVRGLAGHVGDLQTEAKIRKSILAGLGAIGGAAIAALVEVARWVFSRGGG